MTTASPAVTTAQREHGALLLPKFGADGTLTAVAVDANTGELLMLAHMNEDALRLTLETGVAHYWSRSRGKLWLKGETSGNTQSVVDVRIDCDQDAIVMRVHQNGPGVACHTGAVTCFYRSVVPAPKAAASADTDDNDWTARFRLEPTDAAVAPDASA